VTPSADDLASAYKVLELHDRDDLTSAGIRELRKKLSRRYHESGTHPSEDRLKKVNAACDVLHAYYLHREGEEERKESERKARQAAAAAGPSPFGPRPEPVPAPEPHGTTSGAAPTLVPAQVTWTSTEGGPAPSEVRIQIVQSAGAIPPGPINTVRFSQPAGKFWRLQTRDLHADGTFTIAPVHSQDMPVGTQRAELRLWFAGHLLRLEIVLEVGPRGAAATGARSQGPRPVNPLSILSPSQVQWTVVSGAGPPGIALVGLHPSDWVTGAVSWRPTRGRYWSIERWGARGSIHELAVAPVAVDTMPVGKYSDQALISLSDGRSLPLLIQLEVRPRAPTSSSTSPPPVGRGAPPTPPTSTTPKSVVEESGYFASVAFSFMTLVVSLSVFALPFVAFAPVIDTNAFTQLTLGCLTLVCGVGGGIASLVCLCLFVAALADF
jgi:hypothetical protein